ncbi:MAG: MFS transporter [Eubacteriales bacterium]|nr:MFS transporter [Eubacteriales bacterium]
MKKRKLSPYFYLFIVVLQYLTAGFCQYKLQPILTYLMQEMAITEAKAGLLISALSILSVFLAIPFGVLMGKIGPRRTGFLATGVVVLGSLMGTFVTGNFYALFASQLIVGIGICGAGILGPYVIACLFRPELRGRANGWYITAGTIAQLVMYNLVPRITTPENVQPAWWFTTVYALVILVVWGVFITDEVAPPMAPQASGEGDGAKKPGVLSALQDKRVLQLCVGGFAFMMSTMAVLSFAPTYLTLGRGYDQVLASSLVSVSALVGAVSTALGGTLSDILKTRKWVYFVALIWMCVSRVLIVTLPDGILLNLTIWGQGIPAVGMGLLYTVAGEVLEPEKVSVGISAVNMFIGLGGLFAAALFGVFAASFGYTVTFFIFAAVTLLGLVGVCTIKGVK